MESTITITIGKKAVQMRVTRWADGDGAMTTIDGDSGSNGKRRIVAYGLDGSVLRRVTAQDVKEKKSLTAHRAYTALPHN